jgi:hypothetical protein
VTAEPAPDDRDEILRFIDAEIARTPPARSLNPVGCLVFLIASVGFLALSILTRRWELPATLRTIVFAVIVIGMITGLALVFFGAGGGEARARAAATEALDQLATLFETATPQQNLQVAIRLLRNAGHTRGPRIVSTIDVDAARERLARAGVLRWLLEIEQVLVSEKRLAPVFTGRSNGTEG